MNEHQRVSEPIQSSRIELLPLGELCPISGQSAHEERFNVFTHGLGLLLSIIGLVALVTITAQTGSGWALACCSVFGATLVLMYSASTLYHHWEEPGQKRLLQLFDHSCIYLLIAGTYTPFTLLSLQGVRGWWVFGLIWGAALVGIIAKCFTSRDFVVIEVLLYLAMGWAIVPVVVPLYQSLPTASFVLLFAGGAAYSIGVIFYLMERLPYNHTIWHLFVMAGSICHFFAVTTSLA